MNPFRYDRFPHRPSLNAIPLDYRPMLQLFLSRLRHWLTYRPERRYMRGRA
ncbi:hypothetical protein [Belnapia rosea]|uniref:hypothetical protein n=1 Tax=Belnapia rosea TaxID=938405 RepID=UPI00087E186D|nr:hypothetical protein [Belnapia rosea]SDB64309.1 hypothetical protein SAMN02927895_02727 [Belnapia rosea]